MLAGTQFDAIYLIVALQTNRALKFLLRGATLLQRLLGQMPLRTAVSRPTLA